MIGKRWFDHLPEMRAASLNQRLGRRKVPVDGGGPDARPRRDVRIRGGRDPLFDMQRHRRAQDFFARFVLGFGTLGLAVSAGHVGFVLTIVLFREIFISSK